MLPGNFLVNSQQYCGVSLFLWMLIEQNKGKVLFFFILNIVFIVSFFTLHHLYLGIHITWPNLKVRQECFWRSLRYPAQWNCRLALHGRYFLLLFCRFMFPELGWKFPRAAQAEEPFLKMDHQSLSACFPCTGTWFSQWSEVSTLHPLPSGRMCVRSWLCL